MSASPADIGRAIRRARIVTREEAALRDRFPRARDGQLRPEPGFFESAADAATVLDRKASLLGQVRQRFTVEAQALIAIDPLVSIPTHRVVDPETGTDAPALVTRYEYDLETEATTQELVG